MKIKLPSPVKAEKSPEPVKPPEASIESPIAK